MRFLLKAVAALIAVAAAGVLAITRRPAPPGPLPAHVVRRTSEREDAARRVDVRREEARRRFRTAGPVLAAAIVTLIGVGALVAVSGIIPIKASSGHWGITRWFLNASMARSFSTHSLGVHVPPLDSLDQPGLVLKGAGHYETGCRPCHGSPASPASEVMKALTPTPPFLPPKIAAWKPEELFSIVKHGVKFTGMPAWPSQQRDDEVWAMVAFLRALPAMDAEAYQRLIRGDVPAGEGALAQGVPGPEAISPAVAVRCGRCHGMDGLGRGGGAYPRLAGQRPLYLYAALRAYARGTRHSGIMEPAAAGLSPEEMRDLAQYYSRMQAPGPASRQRGERVLERDDAVARGEAIARFGIPSQKVPSCSDCHGPHPTRRNPYYPHLAGQYADYLVLQLQLFNKRQRGGSRYAHLMHPTADKLTLEQMRDVAHYYESLGRTVRSQGE